MKLIEVKPEDLTLSPELSRSGSAKQFEERLQSSIEAIGLAEPLKAVRQPGGGYLVNDHLPHAAARAQNTDFRHDCRSLLPIRNYKRQATGAQPANNLLIRQFINHSLIELSDTTREEEHD